MTLKILDESWDGIEYGKVEFENEKGETIIGEYNPNVQYYNNFWKDNVNDDYLWESEGANISLSINGKKYDNLWCYIVLNETPTFYDEFDNEIYLDDYEIEL